MLASNPGPNTEATGGPVGGSLDESDSCLIFVRRARFAALAAAAVALDGVCFRFDLVIIITDYSGCFSTGKRGRLVVHKNINRHF